MEQNEYTEAWHEPELTPEERDAKAAALKKAQIEAEANAKPVEPAAEGEPPLVNAVQAARDAGLKDEDQQYAEAYTSQALGATE